MIEQPKTFEVDGQTLREQTLIEYVLVLPQGHLARKEFAELQRRAALSISMGNEIEKLKAENGFLMDQIAASKDKQQSTTVDLRDDIAEDAAGKTGSKVKVPCRFCGKEITLGKGFWGNHLKSAHPELNSTDHPQLV